MAGLFGGSAGALAAELFDYAANRVSAWDGAGLHRVDCRRRRRGEDFSFASPRMHSQKNRPGNRSDSKRKRHQAKEGKSASTCEFIHGHGTTQN